VRLEPPAPRLAASLEHRFGIALPRDRVESAMRAEMRHYATICVRAHDDAALAAVRLECAGVLADALAVGLSAPELLPALTDAIAFRLFDDALPALDALRDAGHRLAVVSNWDVSLVATLRRLGIADRFAAVVYSAGVGAQKPDPRPFEVALRRLGVGAEHATHVGDDPRNDVEGARGAGLAAVLVDRDGSARPVGAPRIAALTELPALLAA
jgi:HAD superfamily hydrolase (TIGR01549 family)